MLMAGSIWYAHSCLDLAFCALTGEFDCQQMDKDMEMKQVKEVTLFAPALYCQVSEGELLSSSSSVSIVPADKNNICYHALL